MSWITLASLSEYRMLASVTRNCPPLVVELVSRRRSASSWVLVRPSPVVAYFAQVPQVPVTFDSAAAR